MNNRYLVSIDSGGSKTAFCVLNRETGQRMRCVSGSGNYKAKGLGAVKSNLLDGFHQLSIKPADADFIALGTAGCDTEKDRLVYRKLLEEMGSSPDRLFVCNDAEFIFRALADAPGICLIAGTGSIGFSFERGGAVHRVGGWGAPLSDDGSGFWIGGAFIRAFFDRVDGLRGDDPAFRMIEQKFPAGTALQDIAAKLSEFVPSEIASFARGVLENAEKNSLCREITENAAGKLAEIAAGAYQLASFDCETDAAVVMSGSLFKNTYFRDLVQKTISTRLNGGNYTFVYSSGLPAEDGLKLAEKLAGD